MFLSFGNTKAIFWADPNGHLPRERAARRAQEVDAEGSLRKRLHGTIHRVQISRSRLAIAWRMLQAIGWPMVTALLPPRPCASQPASPGIVNTPELRRVARCSFGDLDRRGSPLPNGRSWCAKELDVAASAGNLYVGP